MSPAGRDAKTGAETHLIRRDGVGALKPGRAQRASYRLGARDLGRRARRRRLVRGRALGSSRAGVAGGRSGQRVRALRTGARNGARERAVKPCGARRARAGRGRGVGASCTRHGLRTRSCAFETRGAGLASGLAGRRADIAGSAVVAGGVALAPRSLHVGAGWAAFRRRGAASTAVRSASSQRPRHSLRRGWAGGAHNEPAGQSAHAPMSARIYWPAGHVLTTHPHASPAEQSASLQSARPTRTDFRVGRRGPRGCGGARGG